MSLLPGLLFLGMGPVGAIYSIYTYIYTYIYIYIHTYIYIYTHTYIHTHTHTHSLNVTYEEMEVGAHECRGNQHSSQLHLVAVVDVVGPLHSQVYVLQ